MMMGNEMQGAVFSEPNNFGEAEYRYSLWRFWNYPAFRDGTARTAMFILANSSTAGAFINDQTVWKVTRLAKRWGYDGVYVGNLMALVETHWGVGEVLGEKIIGPENDDWLMKMRDKSQLHIAAWGFMGDNYPERAEQVRKLFPKLYYLELSKKGTPKHPLYLPENIEPVLWN